MDIALTGRAFSNNLYGQIAIKSVISNPTEKAKELFIINAPRWETGKWSKMAVDVDGIEIYFSYYKYINQFMSPSSKITNNGGK